MKKIKEVIVVEGKDDTKRIHEAVDADTIETRGSAISEETLELIQRLANQRGVIVFTDPDFSGERIRRIIMQNVPNVKHAFIKRGLAKPTHDGSLGVEHASLQAIRDSLSQVYTEADDSRPLISERELRAWNLSGGPGSKARRRELCTILNIGYVNGKQLSRRLSMFGINEKTVKAALEKMDGGKHDE